MPTFLKHRQGSDLTTGFMFTCPTDLVALPGFRKGEVVFFVRPKLVWFFSEQSWRVFHFFSFFLCSSVFWFSPPMVGQFFFLWGTCNYLRRRSFGTFWMIQTPCVFSKKHRGNARHPFRRRIRTISNGSDLCIPSGVGGAQLPMKPWSLQDGWWLMYDAWCIYIIYIYIYTLLRTKKIPEEMTFD